MASKVDMHSGKYSGVNCHGKEKVKRFYEAFPDGKIDNFYRTVTVIRRLRKLQKKLLWLTATRLKVGYSLNNFYGAEICSVFLFFGLPKH